MNARKLGLFIRHPLVWAIIISSMLYVMGVKWLFMPVLLAVLVLYIPYPGLVRSVVARFMAGLLVYYVACQIIATALFIAIPNSNFNSIVLLLAIMSLGLMALSKPQITRRDITWVSRLDMMWVTVAIVTLVPFARIIGGGDTYYRISQIGGGQAIDATNHFAYIAETLEQQRFNYRVGYYYPRGFHMATALIQSSFMNHQSDLGWRGSALLYLSHYFFLLGLFSYAAVYFMASLLTVFRVKMRTLTGPQWIGVSLSMGVGLAILFSLPFIQHGFLNYIYAIATILLGCAVLFATKQFSIHAYALALILFYGASVSWPLLIPIVLGIIAVHLIQVVKPREFKQIARNPYTVVTLGALTILQAVPVIFQLMYYGGDGSQGINLTGDLKIFHVGSLLLSVLIMSIVISDARRRVEEKTVILSALLPVTLFVAILATMQYFAAGEVRYYAIKTAILMEVVLYVIVTALILQKLTSIKTKAWINWSILVFVPILFVGVFALSGNPMEPIRNLFRSEANQEKPQFFDSDLSVYTRLGSEGKIKDYNSTIIHYDDEKGTFFAHMQIPFWANMMQYDGTGSDQQMLDCTGRMYSNLNFGSYSEKEQDAYRELVKRCVSLTKERNNEFYIITDRESYNKVKEEFGAVNVNIIDK